MYLRYHVAGTCAIGNVVDDELRVYHIDNLRIADASIMPSVPSGNTHAVTQFTVIVTYLYETKQSTYYTACHPPISLSFRVFYACGNFLGGRIIDEQ